MGEKISVVINTYNASHYLEQVLESVKDFDEVLICDMESTDDTCEIAKRYGCNIVTFPKENHRICEPARDFAIHSASNKWVLVVDADEVVPETLRRYLYDFIADGMSVDALAVPRINSFMGKGASGTPDYQLRFFIKDKATWPAVIHSRPIIKGTIRNIPNRNEYSLLHLDNPTIQQRIDKINVYTDYEVPKRRNKKYGIGKMLVRPVWFFFRNYVIGKGFMDGRRGVAKAYMAAVYQMVLLSKLLEKQMDR